MLFKRVILLALAAGLIAGCSNTIRGVGRDTANVVDATQAAGEDVGEAASY
ncbi:hypothetical protein GCM10023174_06300 [Chelativorans composti]|jgi:Entericidin EcnA/B family.|uniref:Entericidin n=1 Tax=Chelativorans composti TaxID=768533 RepID=A0ABW5DIJ9_9HYPH